MQVSLITSKRSQQPEKQEPLTFEKFSDFRFKFYQLARKEINEGMDLPCMMNVNRPLSQINNEQLMWEIYVMMGEIEDRLRRQERSSLKLIQSLKG